MKSARNRFAAAVALLAIISLVVLWRVFFGLHGLDRGAGGGGDLPVSAERGAAIETLERRLEANPEDIESLVELGVLHFEKGVDHYPDAVNELEGARELGAMDVRIFYCLGIMYQELGLYDFSIAEYRRYLRNKPDDKEIRMLFAKLLYKRKRYGDAVNQYERLRFHFPKDSLVIENLGLSLWGAKLTSRAMETFGSLKDPEWDQAASRRASYYLGQIAYEQSRYQAGLNHLLGCVPGGKEPDFGISPEKIYSSLAMTYQKLGLQEEGRLAWEKVLKYAPEDPKARVALKELERLRRVKKRARSFRKT